jgi:hypothetical protein
MNLLLSAVNVASPMRWRWLLSDAETGSPMADHQVDLESAADEVARFADLYGYVHAYAAPDRRVTDGARIVAEAAAWAARELLGEAVVAAIAAETPVTVRVVVPEALRMVSLWPLELASADGKPLAADGDVCFVYDLRDPGDEARAWRKAPPSGPLRILAVFSQPTQTSVLALRRERYALSRQIRGIASREHAAVELQVVQYGATRRRLAEIADSEDGWDVLHLSGHGTAGVFLLENEDGTPDAVPTADLVRLLRPARRRARLAVVSACESAVDTTAQTLRLLGLTEQAEAVEATDAASAQTAAGEGLISAASAVPGLARALLRELECPVVAMRYLVTDEFATAFTYEFYEHLLARRQPVDVALARAVARAAEAAPSLSRPSISLVTPVLFGSQAVGLRFDTRRGDPAFGPVEARMAYFPDEPERFVGRAEILARASAALAPMSGRTGILLNGMAGGGKTACAIELAYQHSDSFAAAAFWQAPTEDGEWSSALTDFANRLDIQLGGYGFTMSNHIATMARLQEFIPRLRTVLRNAGVVLVLDNLETLLTADGIWRDPRWELLIAALTSHEGESRVILSSRIVPTGLQAGMLTLPVHALSLDESVALARELPNLRALLHADVSPLRIAAGPAVAEAEADRDRVRRVLRVVQGHPKLMELADAAAADRQQLDTQLEAAEAAAAGQRLDAFFAEGVSGYLVRDFLDALSGWTSTVLNGLPDPARLLALFLACLEGGDRQSAILDENWADLWRRLGRTGAPPDLQPLLDQLASCALIRAEAIEADRNIVPLAYQMHPAVAAAATAMAGPGFQDAVDAELGAFWQAVAQEASDAAYGEDTSMVVRAGLAAVPYLLRQQAWDAVAALLEEVVDRDHSPAVAQLTLPALRRVAEATGAARDLTILGRVLALLDPVEAERVQREALGRTLAAGDYRAAASVTAALVALLVSLARFGEALQLTPQLAERAARAGLGPWSLSACSATRLQVFSMLGEHRQLLEDGAELRARLDELPRSGAADEAVQPWNVYETVLDTMRNSALAISDWSLGLELNTSLTNSMRQRGAAAYEVAKAELNNAQPLTRLGRLTEADQLLSRCQRIVEDQADTATLARLLSARASLEGELGHQQAAADLAATALRLSYARPEPVAVAIAHQNLADHLFANGAADRDVLSHRLAAAMIFRMVGVTHELARALREAVRLLRAPASPQRPTLADVIAGAELIEGVQLGALIAARYPDREVARLTFEWLLATASEPTLIELQDERPAMSPHTAAFADTVVAAVRGDPVARAGLSEALPDLRAAPETAAVAGWVTGVLAGDDPAAELAAAVPPEADDNARVMSYIAAQLGR